MSQSIGKQSLEVIGVLAVFVAATAYTPPDSKAYKLAIDAIASPAAICLLAAGLLSWQAPSNKLWRLGTALVVVLGTLQTIFFAWAYSTVESGPLFEGRRHSLPEGRNILLTTAATVLTISARLRSSTHTHALTLLRSALLVAALVIHVPIGYYALCHYASALPYCTTLPWY